MLCISFLGILQNVIYLPNYMLWNLLKVLMWVEIFSIPWSFVMWYIIGRNYMLCDATPAVCLRHHVVGWHIPVLGMTWTRTRDHVTPSRGWHYLGHGLTLPRPLPQACVTPLAHPNLESVCSIQWKTSLDNAPERRLAREFETSVPSYPKAH